MLTVIYWILLPFSGGKLGGYRKGTWQGANWGKVRTPEEVGRNTRHERNKYDNAAAVSEKLSVEVVMIWKRNVPDRQMLDDIKGQEDIGLGKTE